MLLPLIELWRIAITHPASVFWWAALCVVLYLPLHLRHVRAALAGQRPAHARLTLAAMAVVMGAGMAVAGQGWALMLASLSVSILIIVPAPTSFLCHVAITLFVYLIPSFTPVVGGDVRPGMYLAISLQFRVFPLYVIVWLVAAHARLLEARAELAAAEIAAERHRVETELVYTARQAADELVGLARAAGEHGLRTPSSAAAGYVAISERSRAVLLEMRRALGAQRDDQARAELEAAADLLIGQEPASTVTTPAGSSEPSPDSRPSSAAFRQIVQASKHTRTVALIGSAPALLFPQFKGLGLTGEPLMVPWTTALALGLTVVACHVRLTLASAHGTRIPERFALLAVISIAVVAPQQAFGGLWFSALWILAGAAMLSLPWRAGVAIVVATAGYGILLDLHYNSYDLSFQVFEPLYVGTIWAVAVLALYGSPTLARTSTELASTHAHLAEHARAQERRRLIRDLHDVLGQGLSAISLTAELIAKLYPLDPAAARSRIADLEATANALADRLSAALDGLEAPDLKDEVNGAVGVLSAAGVRTTVAIDCADVSRQTDEVLGWAVREGVTNVLRHASATQCAITTTRRDGRIRLEVCNDGAESGPTTEGTGLRGLRQRAAVLGGTVEATGRSGEFRLRVELPVQS